jgi:hypothetical protein
LEENSTEASIEFIRQMISLLIQAKGEYDSYSKQLSRLDLETQDILHRLEEDFTALQGYHLAKQLRAIRVQRRAVKQHQELLQILISNLKDSEFQRIEKKLQNKLQQQAECSYTPRVLKLSERTDCI